MLGVHKIKVVGDIKIEGFHALPHEPEKFNELFIDQKNVVKNKKQ